MYNPQNEVGMNRTVLHRKPHFTPPHLTCVNTRNLLLCAVLPLLLLAACTHDDAPASPAGIPLPPDTYPLQIASVTISVDGQPRTRLTDEGNSTKWQEGDQIGVRIGDDPETGIYKMDVDVEGRLVGITPIKPVYWKNTTPATVMAWYPLDEEIDFTQQDKGLTYLLKAESVNATYNQSTPINLNFTHQLAKVRVLLEGEKAQDVEKVYVRSYPTSTHTQGKLGGLPTGSTADYFPMYKTTYDGKDCWEATLRDGTLQADNSFQVAKAEGKPVQVVLDENMRIDAGQVYTINISVNPVIPENATDITGDITDNGNYVVRGNRATPIIIKGGEPTIYLENASMNITNDGHAINIQNGNPTIYISGTNNISVNENNYGAGIYVAQGSSVTITGTSVDDVLVVTGGSGGSGIGGYTSNNTWESHPCGNITIENITVRATSNIPTVTGGYAAAIGACGDQTVGTITISNAVVYAKGGGDGMNIGAAAIGGGIDSNSGNRQTSFDEIRITDSEIHATRGCPYASYIGAGGINFTPAGYDIISTAVITNSVIYNESGTVITQ